MSKLGKQLENNNRKQYWRNYEVIRVKMNITNSFKRIIENFYSIYFIGLIMRKINLWTKQEHPLDWWLTPRQIIDSFEWWFEQNSNWIQSKIHLQTLDQRTLDTMVSNKYNFAHAIAWSPLYTAARGSEDPFTSARGSLRVGHQQCCIARNTKNRVTDRHCEKYKK